MARVTALGAGWLDIKIYRGLLSPLSRNIFYKNNFIFIKDPVRGPD